MKASHMLIPTLKEAPQEAQIASHILLIRAGMIKKLVAGVYNFLPLGLRVLNNVEKIIREEMDKAGALEFLSSAVQPKELWEESGRWAKYGPELMRFKDRHDREFCLGPTHEEVFTDLARNLIKSPKYLPLNLYQIQTKYRDELRPRFGLMRGREFIMKDAYSFDLDEKGLEESYSIMYDTYKKIFDRFGLKYQIVLADTGAIGGNGSHQFMALSEIGESNIVYCDCGYAADEEKAEAIPSNTVDDSPMKACEGISTPNQKSIDDLASFLKVSPKETVKALLYKDSEHDKVVMVLVRGDHEVNEIKVINELNTAETFFRMASDDDFKRIGAVPGFMGPIGVKDCTILVDREVANMKNFYAGANKIDMHFKNVNFERDFTGKVIDARNACPGDICPACGKVLKGEKGIEVGQIFKLGTKYSQPMGCTYQNASLQNVPMVMGCYGIGVTRTMASIIEQYHDEFGITWPLNVAPYHAVVVPVNYDDEQQKALATTLYNELLKNRVDVILDDRDAKPGFKFKDWELIGIPYIIIVGKRASENIVEFKERILNTKIEMNVEEATTRVVQAVKSLND